MEASTQYPTATPVPSSRSYWPEAILALLGLGLIGMGGCFLIGVASMYDVFLIEKPPVTGPTNPGEMLLLVVLYACSALSLIGAVVVIGLAVRRLVRS